ncbi:MAG: type I-C CRISPR-associated protein Cas5 [Calditrichaeota bacterium]|nr:type I-C CRISPR-associated protein Cas5 [Calditrichota bacterium]
MNNNLLEVVIRGEYACFTRPEMKVERVSYPVMTPSAARGALEAIFWKPEIHWRVVSIAVLNPIRWFSIKRNEVAARASDRSSPIEVEDKRTQRATLGLRDVGYLLRAEMVLNPRSDKDIAAYRDQFRRRVIRGAAFHRPYLGCREFAAEFRLPTGEEQPITGFDADQDLGPMFFDNDYDPKPAGWGGNACPGTGTPLFFEARLEAGVLNIPQELYAQLRWAGRREQ